MELFRFLPCLLAFSLDTRVVNTIPRHMDIPHDQQVYTIVISRSIVDIINCLKTLDGKAVSWLTSSLSKPSPPCQLTYKSFYHDLISFNELAQEGMTMHFGNEDLNQTPRSDGQFDIHRLSRVLALNMSIGCVVLCLTF